MRARRPEDDRKNDEQANDSPDHAEQVRAITREVDRITKIVERMNLGDYIGLLQRPGRLLWINFLAGLARGLGTILGATLLVSLIIAVANWIIQSNLPGVSDFVQTFVHLLQAPVKGQGQ
jgi:NADPH:quinone reductase-like Zn-dependent oxidoreductase